MPSDPIEDDHGPLRWVRSAIEWDLFEVAQDGRGIRVVYVQAGTWQGPGACIAEVIVAEDRSHVAITLFERDLAGTYPDGAVAARALAAVTCSLEVRLEEPLGTRTLIDGLTGKRPRRVKRTAPKDSDDGLAVRALERGCPIWMP